MSKPTYDVGFKKPPVASRFKKGQSGNPSGRPRAEARFKSLDRILRDALLKETPVQINGHKEKMLRLEAIIAKQVAQAMGGDQASAKLLITLAQKFVPTHLTIAELMEGRKVFEFTEEDRRADEHILDGVPVRSDNVWESDDVLPFDISEDETKK